MDTMATSCPGCGEATGAEWGFCRSCGHGLQVSSTANTLTSEMPETLVFSAPDTAPAGSDTIGASEAETDRQGWQPWKIVAVVTMGLAIGVGLATGGFLWRTTHVSLVASELVVAQTQDELNARTTALEVVEQELADTSAELAETARTLTATQRDLESEKQRAITAEEERDTLAGALDATQTELQGVRGTLDDTRSRVELQAGQIRTLRSCLNGVLLALNYIAYDDWYSAVAALEAVDSSCRDAVELL
jgi:uncharacterized membrane-anchored protein YhcB (DUF1043 family)